MAQDRIGTELEVLREIRDLLREDLRLREAALAEHRATIAKQQTGLGRILVAFLVVLLLWVVASTILPSLFHG